MQTDLDYRMKERPTVQIKVEPSQGYGGYEGWGTSLAWWGNAIGAWQDETAFTL